MSLISQSTTKDHKVESNIEQFYKLKLVEKIASLSENEDIFKEIHTIGNERDIRDELHKLIIRIFSIQLRKSLHRKDRKNLQSKIKPSQEELLSCVKGIVEKFNMNNIDFYEKEILKEIEFFDTLVEISFHAIDSKTEKNEVVDHFTIKFNSEVDKKSKDLNDLQRSVVREIFVFLDDIKNAFNEEEVEMILQKYLDVKNKNERWDTMEVFLKAWIEENHEEKTKKVLRERLDYLVRKAVENYQQQQNKLQRENIQTSAQMISSLKKRLHNFIKETVYDLYSEICVG